MTRPVVRLSSPGELARAIPLLLGYRPTESLVITCLHGDHATVGLTLRFDLDALYPLGGVADMIAARAAVAGADGILVAIYTDQGIEDGDLPCTDLAVDLFQHPGLWVSDALLIHHDRWWSYLCHSDECCPMEGTPIELTTSELTALEASMVLSGSAVMTDRASLVASLACDEVATSAVQRRRVTRARTRVARMDPRARRAELAKLVTRLSRRMEDPRGIVTDAEAVLVSALCEDIGARDDLLLQSGSPKRRMELLSLLRIVVRRMPPPHDAAVCTALAWFAYATGDGTLANIALDRALDSDPAYSLALLLESGLERQLPPSMIEEVVNGAARDIAARDAAG
ncbi:MAG TPA: DUF4192 domain-containing protein [Mycobacteriales bacterium]|nr:DUF4192 domain-containing protein [Mycobacteriales bacterium]